MTSNNNSMQFLICNQCNGYGFIAEKNCQQCHGKGVVGYLDGKLIYWNRKINNNTILAYKIERIIDNIVFAVLLIIAVLGILSLAYYFYEVYIFGQITIPVFPKNKLLYLDLFWISLLFDLYFIYHIASVKAKKQNVFQKQYKKTEATEIIIPPPADWSQISQFKNKDIIAADKAFTESSLRAIENAYQNAQKYHAQEVGPVHFVVSALIKSKKVDAVFIRLGLDLKDFVAKLGRITAKYPQSADHNTYFSPNSKILLLKAYRLAYQNKMILVNLNDIVHESIKADDMIQEVLLEKDISLEKFENVIVWFRITSSLSQTWAAYKKSSRFKSKKGMDRAMTAILTKNLNQYSDDLTLMAKMGYLPLCVNREKEFEEMFRLLEGLSTKAIVLSGFHGVGKTAIIEGLAQKMIADDVPDFLKDKRLVSLSISRLVSGASASQSIQRLIYCLNEVIRSKNVVLFIDNIHDLIGISQAGQQGLDLSEALVEALSKNLFILISTTDPYNYTKAIETSSLGSVLQKVSIKEPAENQAIQVVEGKIPSIEAKNNVFFYYGALEKAVQLSSRFMQDSYLPDKAINLTEEAASWARQKKGLNAAVTANDISELVSEKINMPLGELTAGESKKLLNLEQEIHKRLINQEEAVKAVASSLRRARAELRDVKRPIANLLFIGPTGVGKTELTKIIAQIYFGSRKKMIRLDMSEYQDKDSINRLIGAPPGSPGSAQGLLTEAVRKNPFSIVLLDELEKAHPDILNVFLQVFEDGRLTDATGRTANFTNTIIIATSNAQTKFIQEQLKNDVSLDKIKQQMLESKLHQFFKPEFINRFDNVILFKPLGFPEVVKIAKLLLNDVAKSLEKKGITLQVTDQAVEELAQAGFDPQYGARPLRRAIQDKVDNALAEFMLQGKISRRDTVVLDKGGQIKIKKAEQL